MSSFIEEELIFLRSVLSKRILQTCVSELVRADFSRTEFKNLVLHLRFPPNYPNEAIFIELKSKTLSSDLLDKLAILCRNEAERFVGERQLFPVIEYMRQQMESNLLLTCWEEVQELKELFGPQIKFSERKGTIILTMTNNSYYLNVFLSIPDEYPMKPPIIQSLHTNFLDYFKHSFLAQANDLVRNLAEGPKIFTKGNTTKHLISQEREIGPGMEYPKPSISAVLKFFKDQCLFLLVSDVCQGCKRRIIPDDPAEQNLPTTGPNRLERIYCGHYYHFRCLSRLMSKPPFKEGKNCPACNKKISHPLYDNYKLLETKWAHEQARKREISEVKEFLGV